MTEPICGLHSGIKTDINNLKDVVIVHRAQIEALDTRIDNIMLRLNVVLGGMVVAIIALIANILIEIVK